jgi:hypothetical protein
LTGWVAAGVFLGGAYVGISLVVAVVTAWFLIAMFGEAVGSNNARWDRETFGIILGTSVRTGLSWPWLLWDNWRHSG